MTSLTERYLDAALRGIPEKQRADVEGELRSSIADAVEDRIAAGEDPAAAETNVLEGLGNPVRLASEYAGRPLHLIGPELYLVWRHLLVRLAAIVVPIVLIIQIAAQLYAEASYADAMVAGIGTAIMVGIQLAFWVTVVFAFIERADAARDARDEITGATGRWTVDMLPEPAADRMGAGETVGEVLTTLITIGALLFFRDIGSVTDASGDPIALFDPALTTLWFPAFIAILAALGVLQVVVYFVGRWTTPLAIGNAALQVAFAVPVFVLALSGSIINSAFAAEIGWPPLAEGNGPVMLVVAASVTLVSGWEIIDAFRRARRAQRRAAPARGTVSSAG
jgi:hypothetical protein